ncbi:CD9 antigen-like [Oppia nitens]|uniref:CD9 antigen-like n=1 Tax=Oppia nitens TaxID=1686743 RepID=UPI0023D9B524|nr:CD9 antigen-like [Oppia nitens]
MTSLDPAVACIKYLLFAINFIVWTLGAILLGVAIWVRGDGGLWEYTDNLDIERYYIACYLCMAAGAVILVIGFIGCLGAAMESPCMLIVYFALTAVAIILQIAATVLVWKIAGGDRLQRVLSDELKWHIDRRNTDETSRRFLDLIQLKLDCCGAETFLDYQKVNQDIPVSCNSERTNNIQIRSCGENLRRFLEIRGGAIGGICVALILVEVGSIIFTMCLFFAMKQETKPLLHNY